MKKLYLMPEIQAFLINVEINVMSAVIGINPWWNDDEPLE